MKDKNLYLDVPEGVDLYVDLSKSVEEHLYLEKANPNRDPMSGVYAKGGNHKESMHDLNDEMLYLMDQLPGEDLSKEDK